MPVVNVNVTLQKTRTHTVGVIVALAVELPGVI